MHLSPKARRQAYPQHNPQLRREAGAELRDPAWRQREWLADEEVVLTTRERAFWTRALSRAPSTPDLDQAPATEVVSSLKKRLHKCIAPQPGVDPKLLAEENEVWAQLVQIVREAQEARKLIQRLGLVLPHERQKGSVPAQDVRVEEREQLARIEIAPPSPVRNVYRPAFCAKNVKATLEAMQRHKADARVQEQGCCAIVELIKDGKKRRNRQSQDPAGSWTCTACHFRNRPTDIACRICTGTAHAQQIDQARLDGSVPMRGAQTIASEPVDDTPEWLQVETCGGITVVIDAMRGFCRNGRVVRTACFALAQLAQEDASTVQRIAAAGGIVEILTAMQTLRNDCVALTQCMGIIASPELAADEVTRIPVESFAAVVCESLARYPQISRLQALGYLALANLGVKSDAATRLLVFDSRFAVHQRVLQSIRVDTDSRSAGVSGPPSAKNPHTIASGLWLLVALSRELSDGGHDEIRQELTQAGAIQLAMQHLTAHPTHQSVQANGRMLLDRLGVSVQEEVSSQDPEGCSVQ